MQTYSSKSNARRAAKNQFGDQWEQKVRIAALDDGSRFYLAQQPEPEPEPVKGDQRRAKCEPGAHAHGPSAVDTPCEFVRALYSRLCAETGEVNRKAFVAEAIGAGVNPSTAGVQFHRWVREQEAEA